MVKTDWAGWRFVTLIDTNDHSTAVLVKGDDERRITVRRSVRAPVVTPSAWAWTDEPKMPVLLGVAL